MCSSPAYRDIKIKMSQYYACNPYKYFQLVQWVRAIWSTRPTHSHGHNPCFANVTCPSVRLHFSKSNKKQSENNVCFWGDCGSGWVDHWWPLFSLWFSQLWYARCRYLSDWKTVSAFQNCQTTKARRPGPLEIRYALPKVLLRLRLSVEGISKKCTLTSKVKLVHFTP